MPVSPVSSVSAFSSAVQSGLVAAFSSDDTNDRIRRLQDSADATLSSVTFGNDSNGHFADFGIMAGHARFSSLDSIPTTGPLTVLVFAYFDHDFAGTYLPLASVCSYNNNAGWALYHDQAGDRKLWFVKLGVYGVNSSLSAPSNAFGGVAATLDSSGNVVFVTAGSSENKADSYAVNTSGLDTVGIGAIYRNGGVADKNSGKIYLVLVWDEVKSVSFLQGLINDPSTLFAAGASLTLGAALFGFSGQPASVKANTAISPTAASFGLSSQPFSLNAAFRATLSAAGFGFTAGGFTLTGNIVQVINKASFAFTGRSISTNATQAIQLTKAAFAFAARPLTIIQDFTATIGRASFSMRGRSFSIPGLETVSKAARRALYKLGGRR